MGCVNTKPNDCKNYNNSNAEYKEDKKEYSLSSLSISFSELPYMEPIKTKEQRRIEYIQNTFREEYKRKKYNFYNI